jgi:hypothetical protein
MSAEEAGFGRSSESTETAGRQSRSKGNASFKKFEKLPLLNKASAVNQKTNHENSKQG